MQHPRLEWLSFPLALRLVLFSSLLDVQKNLQFCQPIRILDPVRYAAIVFSFTFGYSYCCQNYYFNILRKMIDLTGLAFLLRV